MNQLPVVAAAKCTGCGECIEICPTVCLEMRGRTPWLPRPRDCVSCAACELICPTDAIVLRDPFENLLQPR